LADELSRLVRIPLTGIGATQIKMERDPDEIVRLLRALRTGTSLLLEKPDYSVALFERILRVEPSLADKLYKLYRDRIILTCHFPIPSWKICLPWEPSG
jgi:hypothetical protein